MILKEYREKYGIPRTVIARKVGVCPATIYHIENNTYPDMRLSVALLIEEVTEGNVTVYDLITEETVKKLRKK